MEENGEYTIFPTWWIKVDSYGNFNGPRDKGLQKLKINHTLLIYMQIY